MMEKRLKLAKRLLKPNGVLIVTIDENEGYHLGVLLEDLFPAYQRYQVTIVINPKGVSKANFSRVEEYAVFCVPGGEDLIAGEAVQLTRDADTTEGDNDELADGEWGLVRRRGTESKRSDRPSMFYPVFIDEERRVVVRIGDPIPEEADPDFSPHDGLRPIWPIDAKGQHRRWQLGAETMRAQLAEGKVALGRYNKKQDSWTINLWRPRKTRKRLKTVWWEKRHDAGTHGTNVLEALLGRDRSFPFPKSIYAVRDCLAAVCLDRPDALIVDFFAGSGTTLQATCMLNREDGGQRRCILVTNNEVDPDTRAALRLAGHLRGTPEYERHGIFESVTRPRCEAAIAGKRPDHSVVPGNYLDGRTFANGFEENVEFFRLDYLDADEVELGRAFESIHPALWLAAGARGKRPMPRKTAAYLIADGCGYAVLFDDGAFRAFEEELARTDDITHVFLATDSDDAYAEMRSQLAPELQTMQLYGDFLRHFRRVTRG
jgi:adenine-specific DNA-methyltransferase